MKKFFKVLRSLLLITIAILVVLIIIKICSRFDKYTTRYGVVDLYGNTVIDFKYYNISVPEQERLKPNYFKFVYADFWGRKKIEGYMDTGGNICFKKDYGSDEYIPYFNYNKAVVRDKETNKEGYIDIHNKSSRDFRYDLVGDFKDGYAWIYAIQENGKGKFGLIDFDERVLVPAHYDEEVVALSEYCFLVNKKDQLYIINKEEKKIADCNYEVKESVNGLQKVVNEITFVDLKDLSKLGTIKSNEKEENIIFLDNFIIVFKDGKTKFFNKNGEFINEKDGFLIGPLRKNDNYFIIENEGKRYILDKYEDFNVVYEENDTYRITDTLNYNSIIAYNKETNRYGLIDFENNIKAPFKYDKLTNDEGFLSAVNGKQKGLVDPNGNELVFSKYGSEVAGDYIITTNKVPVLITAYRAIIGIGVLYLLFILFLIIRALKKVKINVKSYR